MNIHGNSKKYFAEGGRNFNQVLAQSAPSRIQIHSLDTALNVMFDGKVSDNS